MTLLNLSATLAMADTPTLAGVWEKISTLFTTLDIAIAAPAGILGGVLSAIGVAYCIVKTFEGAAEGSLRGTPMLVLLNEFYRLSRKALIVAALVAVSVPTAIAFRDMSIGQVKGAEKAVVGTFKTAAGFFDSCIGTLAGSFGTAPVIAASRMGLLNIFMSGDKAMGQAKAAMAASGSLQPFIDGLNQVQSGNASLPKKFKAQGRAVNDGITADAASKAGPHVTEIGKSQARIMAMETASFAAEQKAAGFSVNRLTNMSGVDMLMAASSGGYSEIAGDVMKYLSATILGYLAFGIALIGLIAGAIALLKDGVGVLSYLVGVTIAMAVGGALAVAFGPALMMCFLTDRTEPYGRSYVQFLFSMAFSALAIGIATKLAAGLIMGGVGAVMSYVGPNIQDMLMPIGGPNLFYSAAFVAIGGVFAGMTVSFFTEVIRRGASIGAGFVAGSFSA